MTFDEWWKEWIKDEKPWLTNKGHARQAWLAALESREQWISEGTRLIAEERRRQVEAEGWTAEHDDLPSHAHGQLADAAACYAKVAAMMAYPGPVPLDEPSGWPWDAEWWKPSSDPIRNLVKAGALITAEIDRLRRLAPPSAVRAAGEPLP